METGESSKTRIALISIVLLIFVLLIDRYMTNTEFRNLIDMKIFGKQVTQNSLDYIEINSDDNPTAFAYSNYIGVLAKNKLSIYNSKGNLENDMTINVSTPIIETNGKYAIIAEKNGDCFFVINSTSLFHKGKIDGRINKVTINPNGYVCVIVSNSTYTSIVIVFDNDGNELFKTYLPSTYAMTAIVSNSNEYVAVRRNWLFWNRN